MLMWHYNATTKQSSATHAEISEYGKLPKMQGAY